MPQLYASYSRQALALAVERDGRQRGVPNGQQAGIDYLVMERATTS